MACRPLSMSTAPSSGATAATSVRVRSAGMDGLLIDPICRLPAVCCCTLDVHSGVEEACSRSPPARAASHPPASQPPAPLRCADRAQAVFDEMLASGVEPGMPTWSALLNAYADSKQVCGVLLVAWQVHGSCVQSPNLDAWRRSLWRCYLLHACERECHCHTF